MTLCKRPDMVVDGERMGEKKKCGMNGCGSMHKPGRAMALHRNVAHGESSKVEIECAREGCDETKMVRKGQNIRYCSQSCSSRDRTPDRVDVECEHCGDVKSLPPCRVGENNFCDRDCYLEWYRGRGRVSCDDCGLIRSVSQDASADERACPCKEGTEDTPSADEPEQGPPTARTVARGVASVLFPLRVAFGGRGWL